MKHIRNSALWHIPKSTCAWLGCMAVSLVSFFANASEPGDEIERVDRRPFKLCTSLDQIRNGEEFIIAYPTESDGVIKMFYMSQNFDYFVRSSVTCNEALSYVTNDTTQVPFLDDAEILSLVDPVNRGSSFGIKFNRSDSEGKPMFLSNYFVPSEKKTYHLGYQTYHASTWDAKITIEEETGYAQILFDKGDYPLVVYMNNWNVNIFACDTQSRSIRASRLPHIYYREKPDGEKPFARTDIVAQGEEWISDDDARHSVHYKFLNPAGTEEESISWKWTWFDNGVLHSTEPATGSEITLAPPVAAVYTLNLNDGDRDYEASVSVYPSGNAHFKGDWYIARVNFPYFIRGYREGYEYSYVFVPGGAMRLPRQGEAGSGPRKASIMSGDTEYDHSVGVPDPENDHGDFYFGIRRNGLTTVHSLGYSETSGVDDPMADGKPETIYDLQGRQLPCCPDHGIYILNGRLTFTP